MFWLVYFESLEFECLRVRFIFFDSDGNILNILRVKGIYIGRYRCFLFFIFRYFGFKGMEIEIFFIFLGRVMGISFYIF